MTADPDGDPLPIQQVGQIDRQATGPRWLVRHLWAHQAVGFIGGPPKCCKSWLGLDLAISIASGTACLGRFEVIHTGPTLVYLAEDALGHVRDRVAGICRHRGIDLHALDLHVITADALRLDHSCDQKRLHEALRHHRPRLLLLDPLIRLHRLDENSSGEISGLLSFLRLLQREHGTAIALVHHMSKKARAQLGQALRGSSDLFAWADSNAYLVRHARRLTLTIEHRSAPSLDSVGVALIDDDPEAPHLEITGERPDDDTPPQPLADAVLQTLRHADAEPQTRAALRQQLRVNNKRLGDALADLERRQFIRRSPHGWTLTAAMKSADHDQAQLSLA
jgi:hypothetical protein